MTRHFARSIDYLELEAHQIVIIQVKNLLSSPFPISVPYSNQPALCDSSNFCRHKKSSSAMHCSKTPTKEKKRQ